MNQGFIADFAVHDFFNRSVLLSFNFLPFDEITMGAPDIPGTLAFVDYLEVIFIIK